jgi:hypothetical protein
MMACASICFISSSQRVPALTELFCYSFLCDHFKGDDLKFRRLALRENDCLEVFPELQRLIDKPHNDDQKKYWAPAEQTLPELQKRYDHALQTLNRLRSIKQGSTDPVGETTDAQYSKAPKAA